MSRTPWAQEQMRPIRQLAIRNLALVLLAVNEQNMTVFAAAFLQHLGKRVVEFHRRLVEDKGCERGGPDIVEAQYYIDRC